MLRMGLSQAMQPAKSHGHGCEQELSDRGSACSNTPKMALLFI